jgi:hypothetical protein
MHKPAYLYLLGPEEGAGKAETVPGVKCFMEDLSDTGCALAIGGQAAAGMRVKAQFSLSGTPICMTGTVRSVDYKEATQRSLLHIEADPLPRYAQNKILGEVFGMQGGDEEDLPYRITDEAAEASAESAAGAAVDTAAGAAVPGPGGPEAPAPQETGAGHVTDAPPPVFTAPDAGDLRDGELPLGAEGAVPVGAALGGEPPLIPFPPEGGIL